MNGYLLGSYRIATAPEPNSSRLTSFKSIRLDSPANNVGPCPASVGCTTNSYSSINPNSANANGIELDAGLRQQEFDHVLVSPVAGPNERVGW